MVLTGQVQREIVGLINAHGPHAVGLSGEDAHVFTAERRDAIVDGEPVDIGLVGDVVAVAPDFVLGTPRRRPHPGGQQRRARRGRSGLQRQRRHGGGGAGRRARRRKARGAHGCRGPLRRVARERGAHQPAARRRARGAAADAARPAWCPRWRPACGRSRAASQGRTSSTAGCRTPCCSRCSPPRASEPWCCRERLRRARRALGGGDDAELRRPAGRPRSRRGGPRLGRRRASNTSTCTQGSPSPASGHAHPAVVEAVTRQVATLAHTSNLVAHEPGVRLAERLLQIVGSDGRVFFCQDGAEANEAALKLARRSTAVRLEPVRRTAARRRGRTAPSTAGPSARCPSPGRRPSASRSSRCPARSRSSPTATSPRSTAAVDDTVAAVFLETTLGEGGVVPAPEGYLAAARAACDRTGALLVVDEVQSGIGRTGHWFASLAQGVLPDVITLAKGLAGGLPLGACIGTRATPARCSAPATTARRSAATRSRARRPSP